MLTPSFSNPMRGGHGSLRLLLLIGIAVTTLLGGSRPVAAQGDPDFGNVPDVLGGQRFLLRSDDLVFGQLEGFQRDVLLTSGLQIQSQNLAPVVTGPCAGQVPQPPPFQSRVGRVFNVDHDVIVHLAPLATAGAGCTGTPNLALHVEDPHDAANDSSTSIAVSPNENHFVLGDVDGDAHPDVLLLNDQAMIVYSAVDPDQPSLGLHEVGRTTIGSALVPRDDPVTADFNGDGALDVAWPTAPGPPPVLDGQWKVAFASICPKADVVVLGQTCTQAYQIVPSSQSITVGAGVDPPQTADPYVALTAGNYAGALTSAGVPTAQLVIAWNLLAETSLGVLGAYSFDAMLTPELRSSLSFDSGEIPFALDPPNVTSGRIAWFGDTDQVVFTNTYSPVVSVVTFDENLAMTPHSVRIPDGGGSAGPHGIDTNWSLGLAVGRFDPPTVGGATNPNLQIARVAMLYAGVPGFPEQTFLEIYDVDPATSFTPTLASTFTIANQLLVAWDSDADTPLRNGNPLSAGDLQARSLALGSPEKITVTGSIQPRVILGMPPMHVDFIQQAGSDPNDPPVVLNVNALPSLYYSQYQAEQSGSNQSANTSTTSYTVATKESIDEKISFGDPDVASVGAEVKAAATQTHDNSVATKYNTYSSQQFDVSTQTGFSDVVWFTGKRFNIYSYRVLGHCVPASGAAALEGCPAGTRPLYVQFSGGDKLTPGRVDGSLLEWYQPVHEPGNVLSYPWTAGLLQDLYAGFAPLTEDPATTWATDSSGAQVSVSWSEGSGSSVTSGTVSTQSLDVSTTVTGSVSLGLFDSSTEAGFDYNSSTSTAALNESSSTLGSSTGIRIVKPPFTNPGQYAYAAQTYIFGQTPATATLQQIPLGTTVTSNGPLWTGFVADPKDRDDGAGVWWPGAYTLPDVALNHPLRWNWTPGNTNHPDEITFNEANAQAPATTDFYFMRGLYVTPASSNGEGPQISQISANEPIRLDARVYNYSFTDMPTDSRVRVRFYGQPWNHQSGGFAGEPFVIDEVLLNPILGFNSETANGQQPNWALASTTFDTTGHADSYLVFWVVVWMQEGTAGDGAMIPEITGHGLTALPGATTPPDAVEIERYSNNVGFYNQPFFVCQAQCATQTASGLGAAEDPQVESLEIAPRRVQQFETASITATLAAVSEPGHDGVLATFYDGDPQRGGQPFDANLISHIRPGDVYVTQAKFRPRTCGPHRIFVVAGTEMAAAQLKVECAPDGTVGVFAGRADDVGSGGSDGDLTLAGKVSQAGPVDLRSATVTIAGLLVDGGRGELVREKGGAPFLPLELRAGRRAKRDEAVFETPPGAKPRVRLEITQDDRRRKDRLELELEVDRASIRRPSGRCAEGVGTAELGTSLSIEDGRHAPIVLNPVLTWRCRKDKLTTHDRLRPVGRPGGRAP